MNRILLLALFASLACTARTQNIPDSLTPAQVRADLDFVVRTIESVHPDPWHDISRARFLRLRDSLAATVRSEVGSEAVYPLVARLCASLNEGHTHAWATPLSSKVIKGIIPVFPVLMRDASESGFTVVTDLSGDSVLHAGDRIVAINGEGTKKLFAKFLKLYGGLDAWRRTRLQNDLIPLLYAAGLRPPYRLRIDRKGQRFDVTRDALAYGTFKPRRDAWRQQHAPAAKAPDYNYERIDSNIALINVNTMEGDPGAFWNFLDTTFGQIANSPTKGVIIDLRRNGGGNSLFGWYLFSFINKKPLRMSGDVFWKVSPEVREWYRGRDSAQRARLDSGLWARYLALNDGAILRLPASAPEVPEHNERRFDGPVAFLIGPHTFSSANMTAATVADYGLATLFGEDTGEPANDYGEVLYFDTPNARVNFGTSSKLFVRPNGLRADKSPVHPDFEVKASEGSDAVLQAARAWIINEAQRRLP
ncbi:MAG: hypothetical protein EOO08_01760 [Chitinophagaceae bacterium]|nr:MAG: hypothetical protein EOO08_01760 [Chitinophagaceae bacterium]